jgi:hypothetical protein
MKNPANLPNFCLQHYLPLGDSRRIDPLPSEPAAARGR